MMGENKFIAHHRESDGKEQLLKQHLLGVADKSRLSASKIGLEDQGELIGLLHDLGKYSDEFQNYLKSAVGLLNQDEDEGFVDVKGLKGKVDHSSAGAQLIWQELSKQGGLGPIVGQVLALCVASHHSGLIDCLGDSGEDIFSKRMNKADSKVHLNEAMRNVDGSIHDQFEKLI
ncbi:MAG: CRISPR-associated endonuclease Cas3'', partial [Mariprofundales bacterium]|nr:CRISPR-associated endonuclease Cas3'' [Mariprofundales bacterium]